MPSVSVCYRLALTALATAAAVNIDWDAFLSRHDPIWRWEVDSTVGYTQHNSSIGHGSNAGCTAVPCSSAEACVDESASQCDACAACASFGLCPVWNNGSLPQLFGATSVLTPNPQWTTYSKGGPILRNHSSTTSPTAVQRWEDGPFLGNGLLGSLIMMQVLPSGQQSLLVQLGRSDVWDRRTNGSQFSVDNMLWDRPRLPLAHYILSPAGNITGGTMRLHLLNATLNGIVNTTAGTLVFSMYVHATQNVIVARVNATGGEMNAWKWTLVSEAAVATRSATPPSNYVDNPPAVCAPVSSAGTESMLCTQMLLAGGNHAYGIASAPCAGSIPSDTACTDLIATVANDWPASSSNVTAAATLTSVMSQLSNGSFANALAAAHAAWWGDFYPTSFLSVPNTTLEGFYYLQLYKLASATRNGAPVMDLAGPWFQRTVWAAIWLDLNLQLQYWPVPASGHHELMQPLADFLGNQMAALRSNAGQYSSDSYVIGGASSYDAISPTGSPGIVGDLPWLMHNLYTFARHTLNDTLMLQVVTPILIGTVNFYRHLLFTGEDGMLHMVPTSSPEYPYPNGPTNDTNFDLALLRWGCTTLLKINATYGLNSSLASVWQELLAQLTPYPTDADGLMISDGVPFSIPHRHFSHAFAVYPLHLLTWNAADGATNESRTLLQKTLDHWNGLTCPAGECPNGFTFDGGSSMSALMTDDDSRRRAAVGNLTEFMSSGKVHASTMYSEGGNPCIESPLAAANSLQEILLQSWGGRVRVFPAVPDTWPDVVVANMSAEGGFTVTAVRSAGVTSFITIGAPPREGHSAPRGITLNCDMTPPFDTLPAGVNVTYLATGDVTFAVPVGSNVTLFPRGSSPNMTIAPLPGDPTEYNFWGLK